jgi:hypothetical protein
MIKKYGEDARARRRRSNIDYFGGAIDRTINTKLGKPISAQMFGLQRSQAITAFLFLKQEVSLPI